MMKIYVIFAVIGWAWAAMVGVALLLWWLTARRSDQVPGFDVIEPHEKQH